MTQRRPPSRRPRGAPVPGLLRLRRRVPRTVEGDVAGRRRCGRPDRTTQQPPVAPQQPPERGGDGDGQTDAEGSEEEQQNGDPAGDDDRDGYAGRLRGAGPPERRVEDRTSRLLGLLRITTPDLVPGSLFVVTERRSPPVGPSLMGVGQAHEGSHRSCSGSRRCRVSATADNGRAVIPGARRSGVGAATAQRTTSRRVLPRRWAGRCGATGPDRSPAGPGVRLSASSAERLALSCPEGTCNNESA
jgi:hypothetical protein